MAEANSNLNIIVKVRDEASGALSRLSGDVSDLGGSLNFAGDKAGILASALAAIGATSVLKNAINSFAEGEAQMAKFDAILKTLPVNLQAFRTQILATANDALLKFGFSNEDAALSMARLLQATHDGSFAMQAFQAAMDLARYKGISLDEATQALIIAFQGGGRLLKQFGIEVDDHASKETILAAVMRQTGGQAEAYARTLKGQFEIIGNLFDEFNKGVGAIFAPAISAAINAIKGWIESVGGLEAATKLLQPVMTGFAVFMGGLFVAGAIAATVALGSMIGISALVVTAIATLAAVVTLFVTLWQNNWEQARAIFEIFRINAESIWTRLTSFIRSTFGSAIAWIRSQLQGVVDFFNSIVNAVADPIKTGQQNAANIFQGVVGSLKGIFGFAEGGIVTRPTLAMVGEGGESEAIIPLSKLNSVGGGGVTVYLQGDFYTTAEVAEKFGNEIARIIKNNLNLAIRA